MKNHRVNPSGTETEIVNYALDCDTLKITGSGEWADTSQDSDVMVLNNVNII